MSWHRDASFAERGLDLRDPFVEVRLQWAGLDVSEAICQKRLELGAEQDRNADDSSRPCQRASERGDELFRVQASITRRWRPCGQSSSRPTWAEHQHM